MSLSRIAAGLCALGVVVGCGGGSEPGPGRDAGLDAVAIGLDSGPPGDAGCVHTGPPVIDPTDLPECPMCSGGRCVAAALIPVEQRGSLADCSPTTKCVPDLFLETGGDFLLATCRSVGDSEGRCVSICIPQIAAAMESLPQASCEADERCAPCYDPTSGEDTGLCSLACDTGPVEPAPTIVRCCGGAGTCIPESAVPAETRAQLAVDTCPAGMGYLCAPAALTDPTSRPPTCRSIGGGEGRCLPECLPAVAEQRDSLPMDSCAAGERCLPCYSPTDGVATGVCEINGDMPAEPPFTFPRCCTEGGVSRGTCVPMASVPEERRMDLTEQECPMGEGYLCVPTSSIEDPDRPPVSCTTGGFVGGGEPGACILACMVGGFEGFLLDQSTCADYELCAPCTDPIRGGPTGACG